MFTAVVEPGRADALIGAIVLEELDFVPDCSRQALLPARDPLGMIAEIDRAWPARIRTSCTGCRPTEKATPCFCWRWTACRMLVSV